jgi:hypothetical protein
MPTWAYSTSMGELKSMTTDSDSGLGVSLKIAWWPPSDYFPFYS